MILRKLADAIRTQNWFTVFIEFTLVVAGVLVALQFDNWNSERQNRAEERRLASQLLGELTSTIENKTRWIAQTEAQRTDLENAIHVIQQTGFDASLSKAQCDAAWSSHIISIGVSHIATLDEILSSGGIGKLKDENLRAALLAFSNEKKAAATRLAFIRADFVNLIDAHAEAFPRTFIEVSPSAPGIVAIDTEVICDLSLIRANQTIRNELISNLGRTTGVLITARSEVASMENLKTRLSEVSP